MGDLILHLNTYDRKGGAARAIYRMHKALQFNGVNSLLLVESKLDRDPSILGHPARSQRIFRHVRGSLDRLPILFVPDRQHLGFSTAWLPDRVLSRIREVRPSLIHLHWINGGWIQVETLKRLPPPLVWTFQDMWPFTGGCHYDAECGRYKNSCGECPLLSSNKATDLSRWNWRRKFESWRTLDVTIVAVSHWIADCVRQSPLHRNRRIEIIPNSLDTLIYRPKSKYIARNLLSLPEGRKLILFGALEPLESYRKGFHLLKTALESLARQGWGDKVELVLFGASSLPADINLGIRTRHLGSLSNDLDLVNLYSAADVTAVPSLQEAFGQVASESMACGTPVVGFNHAGLKDIVDHEHTGYLARPFDPDDLATGISWVLGNPLRWSNLSRESRSKVEMDFDVIKNASRLSKLYDELLEERSTGKPIP